MKKGKGYTRELMLSEVTIDFEKASKSTKKLGLLMVTRLEIILGVLNLAVSTFNGEKLRRSNDWREHLKSYIDEYSYLGGEEHNVWKEFEHGFSGSHFFLHDGLGKDSKRVIMIYSQEVTIFE